MTSKTQKKHKGPL